MSDREQLLRDIEQARLESAEQAVVDNLRAKGLLPNEQPSTTPPARGAGSEWTSVNMTEDPRDPRFTIEQGDKLLATVYDAATAARIIAEHEQHSTLIEQRQSLVNALEEVRSTLGGLRNHLNRSEDNRAKDYVDYSVKRIGEALTTIEQEWETR